ncbi:MAG: hypothetical protein RR902_00720 [Oscillospiraceae bacterium]
MQNKKCWLCGKNEKLEKHHIFGGAYRKSSEKYGLTVDLCGETCHRTGKQAAHNNKAVELKLKQYGQKKVMTEQNWSVQDFRLKFGKNYLDTIFVLKIEVGKLPRTVEVLNDTKAIERELGQSPIITKTKKYIVFSGSGNTNFILNKVPIKGTAIVCANKDGKISGITATQTNKWFNYLCE